jgi:hypothetical protein
MLDVSPALFDLLAARQDNHAPNVTDHLEDEVVWLHTDFSTSFYLTRRGRMLVTDVFEPDAHARAATDAETTSALVLAGRSVPQLMDLLPPRPATAVDCGKCRASRWWTLPARDVNGEEIKVICPDCAGKGWQA